MTFNRSSLLLPSHITRVIALACVLLAALASAASAHPVTGLTARVHAPDQAAAGSKFAVGIALSNATRENTKPGVLRVYLAKPQPKRDPLTRGRLVGEQPLRSLAWHTRRSLSVIATVPKGLTGSFQVLVAFDTKATRCSSKHACTMLGTALAGVTTDIVTRLPSAYSDPISDPGMNAVVPAVPLASDLAATTLEDTPVSVYLTVTVPDALRAIDPGPLSYSFGKLPAHGTLTGTPPDLIYTPSPNFNGTDSFTFAGHLTFGDSLPATVSIQVTPVADPPIAIDDLYAMQAGTVLSVPAATGVLSNDLEVDGHLLTTISASISPQHGTLVLDADGSFTYTPEPGFTGTDSFTYKASDGALRSPSATVRIVVS